MKKKKNKKGMPYLDCPECWHDGACMIYGHPCGSMRCREKPEEYQPDRDTA